MGTSTSSSGPVGGVSFDPPWLDQLSDPLGNEGDEPDSAEPEEVDNVDPSQDGSEEMENPSKEDPPSINPETSDNDLAPKARYGSARLSLGKFVRDGGGRENYNKAIGRYSKKGMGGAGRVASRMSHSTKSASGLAHFLGEASSRSSAETNRWVDSLTSQKLSSDQIIDAIVAHIAPTSGSREEESSNNSMAQAMKEYLEKNEDADLLDLGEDDIHDIVELYIANEAYNRIVNDIARVFEEANLPIKTIIDRQNEMHSYLVADISAEINKLWAINSNPSPAQLNQLLQRSIKNTFETYEVEA